MFIFRYVEGLEFIIFLVEGRLRVFEIELGE